MMKQEKKVLDLMNEWEKGNEKKKKKKNPSPGFNLRISHFIDLHLKCWTMIFVAFFKYYSSGRL